MIEVKRHPFPYGKFFMPFFPSGGRVLSGDGSAGTGVRHPDAGTALCPGMCRPFVPAGPVPRFTCLFPAGKGTIARRARRTGGFRHTGALSYRTGIRARYPPDTGKKKDLAGFFREVF